MNDNKYLLPKSLYYRVLWLIKDYPRLKLEYETCIAKAHTQDGQPRGTAITDTTAVEAEARLKYGKDIDAIDSAFEQIPKPYRLGIYQNIAFRKPYDLNLVSIGTWKKWRQRLVYFVAEREGWI